MQVLEEMLMGKRVELSTVEGSFWRGFGGEQSPSDLETALQLVFRLFRTRVQPVPAELATCLRCRARRAARAPGLVCMRESLAILVRGTWTRHLHSCTHGAHLKLRLQAGLMLASRHRGTSDCGAPAGRQARAGAGARAAARPHLPVQQ